jgi:hypothetical protein
MPSAELKFQKESMAQHGTALAKKLGRADPARKHENLSGLQAEQEKAIDVFQEIYELLEDYAPAWFSKKLHERTKEALRVLGRG